MSFTIMLLQIKIMENPNKKKIKKEKIKYQTLTGMSDILPREQKYFQKIYQIAEDIFKFYGFSRIDTPILEESNLFTRSIGTDTDIVDKEMYIFKMKHDKIALRPEFTASIARAYIEHGMFTYPQPVKLFSIGQLFRHNKPQAGRYRQFYQVNAEVLGSNDSITDAQIIQIFYNILKKIGIKNLVIEINSIGDRKDRKKYNRKLSAFFESQKSLLCIDCRKKIKQNPLRIFDCKIEQCSLVRDQAPQIIDNISEQAKEHFKQVLEFLDEVFLPYRLNPYLVRGLDYYNRTVFEIFCHSTALKGRQGQGEKHFQYSLLGGGRYDYLVEDLGGRGASACGAAMGVERVVEIMKILDLKVKSDRFPKVFLACIDFLGKKSSLRVLSEFRKAKIPIAHILEKKTLKAQLEYANKIGIRYCLIIGREEAISKNIIVKRMETRDQIVVKQQEIIKYIKNVLKN